MAADAVEESPDFVVAELRARETTRAGHRAGSTRARLVEQLVPNEERDAKRAARIAGGRLDPEILEGPSRRIRPLATQLSATPPARQRFFRPVSRVHVPRHPQHDFLDDDLDRGGKIHIALGEQRLGSTRRAAEEPVELLRRHRQPLAVVEVRHVHAERPVVLQVDQLFEDQVDVLRLAVGGQAHQLVLARIDLESAVIGEGRVEHAGRVRKVELVREIDAVAAAGAVAGGGPLAHAVDGKNGGFFERRGKEGAGRVRLVVLGEDESLFITVVQSATHFAREIEFFLEPDRHGRHERPKANGRKGQVGFQQPLEFQKRLVVEADVIELLGPSARPLSSSNRRLAAENSRRVCYG